MNKELYNEITKLRTQGHTWNEVGEILNLKYGNSYDESAYRKPYHAYRLGQEDSINDVELAEQLQRVALEKKKLGILRGATNEMIRDVALKELYHEQLLGAIDNLPKIFLKRVKPASQTNDKDYVVVFTDLHYDGSFDLESIFEHLFSELANFFKDKDIRKLTILELGDTIEGSSLRPSQMRGIKTGMIDQIITVSNHYSVFLSTLQRTLATKIDFHIITSSNHTQLRPLNTKRNELPDEDLMKVFSTFLKQRFNMSPEINIIEGEYVVVDVGGSSFYFAHGDKHKMTPNTVVKTSKDISMYHGEIYDYYGFGHFHQYRDVMIDKSNGKDSKAFLFPALCPTKDSYERLGLMGANPAFSILEFDKGIHKTTTNIRSLSFN